MNKVQWREHIEATTGAVSPFKGGSASAWIKAVQGHSESDPQCQACAERRATRRKSTQQRLRSRAISEAYKSAGMVKVRSASGRVCWE